jgi:2-oxoglutarate dehydrogenase E1 component
MGAWYFVEEQIQGLVNPQDGGSTRRRFRYVGRPAAASTATGAHTVHHDQQTALVNEAFAESPAVIRKARRLVRKKRQ